MTSRPVPVRLLLPVSLILLTGLVGHSHRAVGPLALDADAQAVATIASDLPDYPPGRTVTLTGHGWLPHETVTIVLHRDPFVHADEVLTSVADANGTITNTSFKPAQYDLGVKFFVTATGSQSGRRATTTFTSPRVWNRRPSASDFTQGAEAGAPRGVPPDRTGRARSARARSARG